MPLGVAIADPLSLPADAFDDKGLAVLIVNGGRYGGDWVIHASRNDVSLGELHTDAGASRDELTQDPRYPWLAMETAFIWLSGEAQRLGYRVVEFGVRNNEYAPGERPYFCLAVAILAGPSFVPMDGVVYADQKSLNQVMGYAEVTR